MVWDGQQVEQNGKRQALCVELILGKRAILCASLNPADVFLGLCSVPLRFFLLIKDCATQLETRGGLFSSCLS